MKWSWEALGVSWVLGASWDDLVASWGVWGPLGVDLQPLGVVLKPLGAVLGPLGAVLEPLGAVLCDLGHQLACVAQSWGYVGTFSAASWDKDAEDEPRWTNMGAERVAKGIEIQSLRGCRWRLSARFDPLGAFRFGNNLKSLPRTFILVLKRCLRLWWGRRIIQCAAPQSRHCAELEEMRP